ncbi:MAG TPA: hypothetical protein VFR47_14480 [Anaerolineales bacterium]|nr:hypothetical protein [Anaerolineales bacterium]
MIVMIGLFLVACGPPQPVFVDQYPTLLPTPTLAVITKPIGMDEKEEVFDFFYELKNLMALDEYEHFAEEIRYPITVNVDGQAKTFIYVAEFEADFEKIFSEDVIQRFISTDESELIFTQNGVKVPDGIIWFNLICMDSACEEEEFLITEINRPYRK